MLCFKCIVSRYRLLLLRKFTTYLKLVKNLIQNYSREKSSSEPTFDLFETPNISKLRCMSKKLRFYEQKRGLLFQNILGSFFGFKNYVEHEDGIDIISYDHKIAIELKYRSNTDNHSSRSFNNEKLRKFKRKNKNYRVIYAFINCSSAEKTSVGLTKSITFGDETIEYVYGVKVFELIYNDAFLFMIKFIKNELCKNDINIDDTDADSVISDF